jgi:diamine N-acetyltransferase
MRTFTGKEPISIVPLDKTNWEDAVKLQVQPDQVNFVASNVYSIAESKYYPALLPCGIYASKTMVGFLMYGRDDEDHQYWIYRFMIDQRYQRQGFGRRAMLKLIELLRELPDVPELNISYDLDNIAAAELYMSVGFIEGGIASWGERTAKLTFS